MQLDSAETAEVPLPPADAELPSALLELMCDDAVRRGLIDDGPVSRDLFDTKLMGVLTPAPHEVRRTFASLYAQAPALATDWYYAFSQDTNYIRRDRIAKDVKWLYDGEYGKPSRQPEMPLRQATLCASSARRMKATPAGSIIPRARTTV